MFLVAKATFCTQRRFLSFAKFDEYLHYGVKLQHLSTIQSNPSSLTQSFFFPIARSSKWVAHQLVDAGVCWVCQR